VPAPTPQPPDPEFEEAVAWLRAVFQRRREAGSWGFVKLHIVDEGGAVKFFRVKEETTRKRAG
jgi:hypothetical protein